MVTVRLAGEAMGCVKIARCLSGRAREALTALYIIAEMIVVGVRKTISLSFDYYRYSPKLLKRNPSPGVQIGAEEQVTCTRDYFSL